MKRIPLFTVLAAIFLSGACIAQTENASDTNKVKAATSSIPDGQRVFYAAHSLMWDTPVPVEELAKAYGISDHVLVGVQRIGFSYTRQHWEMPDAQNQAKQALQTGKVDNFFMSPMELPDEGIDSFVKFGLLYNPNIRFFVQNNWAAFNIDAQGWHTDGMAAMGQVNWDATTVDQIPKLNAVSEKEYEKQVTKINDEVGHPVLFIIPTSQANTAIRIKIAQQEFPGLDRQSQLFADKIGHPAAPLIALNAYVHFATIYGRSPVGLPIPSVLKRANNPKWNDAFNKALQELAWKTVLDYSQWDGVKAPAEVE